MKLVSDIMRLSGRDLRDSVLSILTEEWPLSAREIHRRVSKDYKINVTYQGVHKAVRQMADEGLLVPREGRYSINLQWVNQLVSFGKKVEGAYKAKVSELPLLEVGVGSSVEGDAFAAGREAATKAMKQLKHLDEIQLALVFTSSYFDGLEKLLEGVRSITKNAPLAGCTNFGEIADKPLSGTAMVVLFAADKTNFSAHPLAIPYTSAQFEKHEFASTAETLKQRLSTLSEKPDLGLLFVPGYMKKTGLQILTPHLLKHLNGPHGLSIPIAGCGAGDDWAFERSFLFCNGKVYEQAIVFISISTPLKFGIACKSGFAPVNKKRYKLRMKGTIATEVAELTGNKQGNWQPILNVYTKETKISARDLKLLMPQFVREVISQNKISPVGIFEKKILAWPLQVIDDGLLLQNSVADGDIVQIAKATPDTLEQATCVAASEAIKTAGISTPAAAFIFECSTFMGVFSSHHRNEIEGIRRKGFKGFPIAGAYCGGELWPYSSMHANGTAIAIVFGNEKR